MLQSIYLVLSLLGFALPYSQIILFFIDNGLNLSLFWSELLANQISTGLTFDFLVSSAVFWIFVFKEGTRLNLKVLWVYVVLNLIVGLSFALPVFLWVRLRSLEKELIGQEIS